MKSYSLTELRYRYRDFTRSFMGLFLTVFSALLIAIGVGFLWPTYTGQTLDVWLISNFYALRGERQPPKDVVLVPIDDDTYRNLALMYPDLEREISPKWPFPRRFIAEALENLVKAQPKAIIIDARFPAEREDTAFDGRIEAALRAGPTSIWSGVTPQPRSELDVSDTTPMVTIPSEKRFREAAHLQLPMLARSHPHVPYKDQMSLTRDERAGLYERTPIAEALEKLAGYKIDLPGTSDLINFYGPALAIPRVSLYKLVGEHAAAQLPYLKDKVVLVGFISVSRGLGQIDKDAWFVPSSKFPMGGTEIHANVVGNLIDRTWLRREPQQTEASVILYSAFLLALIGVALPLEYAAAFDIVLLLGALCLNYHAFAAWNRWYPGLPLAFIAALAGLLCGAVRRNLGVRKFKAYLKRTFGFEMEKKV